MAADYICSGMKWEGPRRGINWAGVVAWTAGFAAGAPALIPGLPTAWVKADNLAVLYSFATGFLAYFALAKLGLEPSTVDLGEPTRANAGSVSAVSQNG